MTTAEMKNILAKKLKDENTYFTKSHINIKKLGEGYKIIIKDYEHIPFKMNFSFDNYFGYQVWIRDMCEGCNIIFVDSKKNYDIETALIHLGYYISTRF